MIFSYYQTNEINNAKHTNEIEKDTTILIKKWLVYNEHLRGLFKQIATTTKAFENIDYQNINEEIKKLL